MSIRSCTKCKGDGFFYQNCGCREAGCDHDMFATNTDESESMYAKFWVRRTDGSSCEKGKHERCDYFVLDWKHDPFAIPAAFAYADACEAAYPELAADIRKRANAAAQVVFITESVTDDDK